MNKPEFQTRRESGEIRHFPTLKQAVEDADDRNVWKLSFSLSTGERVRLIKRSQWGSWGKPSFVLEQMPDFESVAKGEVT